MKINKEGSYILRMMKLMMMIAVIGAASAFAQVASPDSAQTLPADSVQAEPASASTQPAPASAPVAAVQPASPDSAQAASAQAGPVAEPADSVSADDAGDGGIAQSDEDADEFDDDDDSEELAAPELPRRPEPIRIGGHNRLDGIAAVVGDEVILLSELEAYVYMRLIAVGLEPQHADLKKIAEEGLEELINNKVLLVRAREDTTIHVRTDEVESTLNNHITMILRQNGITMEQFEMQLRIQQGTTMARFKSEARRAIREQLYKQKLQQQYYFGVKVNRRDVEHFFEQYSDSLPAVGESFEMLKLSLRLTPSDSVRQAAFDKINMVKRLLDAGGSFDSLARVYSESPEASVGGDLGYLSKGSTEFLALEERAFALPVGQVSRPFETRLGFHVIVVEEKRDRRVRLRQILVKCAPTEQEREALIAKLDSLRENIKGKAQFEEAAKSMSVDNATRTRGGNMGWVSMLELPPTVRTVTHNLEAGQISTPIADDNTLSIYMVNGRTDSRRLTLENDYLIISEKAKDIAAQKKLLDAVKSWREKMFVDKRI